MHLLPDVEAQRAHIFGHIDERSGGHHWIFDWAVSSAGSRITQFMYVVMKAKKRSKVKR